MPELSHCISCIVTMCTTEFNMPQQLVEKLTAQDEHGAMLITKVIESDDKLSSALASCRTRTKCCVTDAGFLFPHLMSAVISYFETPADTIYAVLQHMQRLNIDLRHWVFSRFVRKRQPAQIAHYLSPEYIAQYYGLTGPRYLDRDYVLCMIGDLLATVLSNCKLPCQLAVSLTDYFVWVCRENPAVLDFISVPPLVSTQNTNLTQEAKDSLFHLLLDYPCCYAVLEVISCIDCPTYFVRAMADIVLGDTDMPEILRLQRITALLDYQAERLEEHIRLALEILRSHYMPATSLC